MPVTKYWTAGLQVVNGWNNVKDLNDGKTFGITNAFTFKKFAIFDNYYVGPEKIGTTQGQRHFNDLVVTINPTDRVAMYVNYDYGADRRIGGGSDRFQGIAGAVRFQIAKKWAFSPRLEFYRDRDGFITGRKGWQRHAWNWWEVPKRDMALVKPVNDVLAKGIFSRPWP